LFSSPDDKYYTEPIVKEIQNIGLKVLNFELEVINNTVDIYKDVSAGDFIIIAYSDNSMDSEWMHRLLKDLDKKFISRDIFVITLLVGDCEIPDILDNTLVIDALFDPTGVNELVRVISNASLIDFSLINEKEFENLVVDLLKELDFKKIIFEPQTSLMPLEYHHYEFKADILAEHTQTNPFGFKNKEQWIIELKFYKKRVDPKFIDQLMHFMIKLPEKYKVVIFTNSQLTSISKNKINEIQKKYRIQINIIDGPKFRNLLISYPWLIRKYFSDEGANL
jgi:hypothetical protein